MPEFPPLGHVALTVTDVRKSAEWYERLLGTGPVIDEDTGPYYHVVFALPGGCFLGLHEHPSTDKSDRFDEFRVGLDHVAFGCASRTQLERWEQKLDEMGIRHGKIEDHSHGSDLSFRDPDNNALEFFAPLNTGNGGH